jgi:hypothetical protein
MARNPPAGSEIIPEKTGSIALSVFPVPVGAIRRRCLPSRTRGMAWSWISESSMNPRFRMHACTLSSSCKTLFIGLHRGYRSDKCPVGKEDLCTLPVHAPGEGAERGIRDLPDVIS